MLLPHAMPPSFLVLCVVDPVIGAGMLCRVLLVWQGRVQVLLTAVPEGGVLIAGIAAVPEPVPAEVAVQVPHPGVAGCWHEAGWRDLLQQG